jgi:hypothetical protein
MSPGLGGSAPGPFFKTEENKINKECVRCHRALVVPRQGPYFLSRKQTKNVLDAIEPWWFRAGVLVF